MMTATEVQNIQEAFVISLGFSIEVSLALVMLLVVFILVCWLFAIPSRLNRHDS